MRVDEPSINLADKIYPSAYEHREAYEKTKDVWAAFIDDPSTDSQDYIGAVTDHVRALEQHNVPIDERTDVIIAAFWAASAESVLNQRAAHAGDAEQNIRDGLDAVWEEVDGQ